MLALDWKFKKSIMIYNQSLDFYLEKRVDRAKASMMVATVYVSMKQNTRLGSEFSKMFPY